MKPAPNLDTANAPTTQLSSEPVTVKRNHIDDYMQIPVFNSVLSHGDKPLLTLPKAQLASMMALGTDNNRFIVLCLPSEYRSTGWFNLIEQGKRLKLSFAGAFTCQVGKLIDADGGTLFLDEVGELPVEAQVKLLRLLQTGEVMAAGARYPREVDVRIVAATNRPLLDRVAAGHFREDLYYRLAVVQLTIPPLRERRADVPALARHLLNRIARQPGLRDLGITDEAMTLLSGYSWPGNVRQLHDVLFRAAVLCEGDALTAGDFPHIAAQSLNTPQPGQPSGAGVALYQPDGNLRALDAIEADVIRLAIGHYRGRMTEVARRLGIGRSTLYRKLTELGISDAA